MDDVVGGVAFHAEPSTDSRASSLVRFGRTTPALLIVSFAAVLLLSVWVGPDANWDLRNYHYYNGRAIVTWSFLTDVAPAGIQTYSNPVIDVPIYLAIELLDWRWGLILWTAIVQWFCYLALWRLTGAFAVLRQSIGLRITAFGVAVSGVGAASLAFTTFGDWVVAALACESLTRFLRVRDERTERPSRELLLSGVMLGLAAGVKMTAATLVIAFAVAVTVVVGRQVARFVVGAVVGFLALQGLWMAYLMARFGNPLFPYYNKVFRSSSAPVSNFDDWRYGATSVRQIVRFPIDVAQGGVLYSELYLREWRFLAIVALLVISGLVIASARLRDLARDRAFWFWPALLLIAFVLWICVFGIYRYFLFVEIVVSILIVVLLAKLISDPLKAGIVAVVLAAAGFGYQVAPQWGRGDVLRNDTLRALVAASPATPSHVVFVGPPPFGYLADALPAGTSFAALYAYDSNELRLEGRLREDLDAFLADGEDEGALFAVVDQAVTTLPPALDRYNLTECREFESLGRILALCSLDEPAVSE